MVVLRGGAVTYERGTPVPTLCASRVSGPLDLAVTRPNLHEKILQVNCPQGKLTFDERSVVHCVAMSSFLELLQHETPQSHLRV